MTIANTTATTKIRNRVGGKMTTSPPQDAEREQLQVPVRADLKRELRVEAAKRETSMAALVEEALAAFLERK